MAEANPIPEGFLCPICHKDLRSPQKLIAHFQEQHSEEQDLLKSVRELYGKAKKKILKQGQQYSEPLKNQEKIANFYRRENESSEHKDQTQGCWSTHTNFFRAIRRERLDHKTAETNKLIIRLDKLLRLDGTDRKQQEQFLVAWLDGSTVSRCPSCTAGFNIARRQHHCRLCGSIMCNDCSIFLPFERAQSIVVPVQNLGISNKEGIRNRDTDNFRICCYCSTVLEHKRQIQSEQMMQPIICQLYLHLQELKSKVQVEVNKYKKMYKALMVGESTYKLQDAHSVKGSIEASIQTIDTISKKIASLAIEESTPKVEALQNSIRRATANYIKDCLLALPLLPSEEELVEIRKNRLLIVSKEENLCNNKRVEVKRVTVTSGWSPSVLMNPVEPESDPLIEQINNVHNYIKQAKKEQRFDEVSALEENLRVLEKVVEEKNLLSKKEEQ